MGFMRTAYDAFKFSVALRVQLQGAFGSHAGLLRFDPYHPYALWLKFFAVTGMRILGPRRPVGRNIKYYKDRGTLCHSIPRARRSKLSVLPGQCHPHARIRATLPDAPTYG